MFVIHQLSLRWFLTPPQNKTRISYHTLKCRCKSCLCLLLDSNQRPPDSESGALSAELKRLAGSKFTTLVHSVWFVHLGGFEPLHPYRYRNLSPARLPVPPQALTWVKHNDWTKPDPCFYCLSKEQCEKLTHYTDVTLHSIPQWNRTIAYGFGDRRSTIELGAFTKSSW